MEIVSGRSAVDFDLELGEHFLVQKVYTIHTHTHTHLYITMTIHIDFTCTHIGKKIFFFELI